MRKIILFFIYIITFNLFIACAKQNEEEPSFINNGIQVDIDRNYISRQWLVSAVSSNDNHLIQDKLFDFNIPNQEIKDLSLIPLFDYYTQPYQYPQDDRFYFGTAPIGEDVYIDRDREEVFPYKFNLQVTWDVSFKDGLPYLDFKHTYISYGHCSSDNPNSCYGYTPGGAKAKFYIDSFQIVAANQEAFAIKATLGYQGNMGKDPWETEDFIILFNDASQ